ncbi:hypothetical protein J6S88_06795 [bacterium]|nr:hypothetical protein [bacterium]
MKINSLDTQDFDGKFYIVGKMSDKNRKVVKKYISKNKRIKNDIFYVHIKETNSKNILMSLNENFTHSYGISKNNLSIENLHTCYLRLWQDAYDKYRKCSAIDQILCLFNFKKII